MKSSESIATIASALVEAQKEFAPALKTSVNPHFKSKYVDLASAIEAAQPALLKNGIAVLQGTAGEISTQSITVTTRIIHSSGEWIEDALTLPAVNRGNFDAQSAGSAITYARRYSYMSILGFAPEDDDGNAASGHFQQKPQVQPVSQFNKQAAESLADDDLSFLNDDRPPVPTDSPFSEDSYRKAYTDPLPEVPQARKGGPVVSEAQAKRFFGIAMGSGKSKADINHYLASKGYASTSDILKKEYESLCEWAASK
jgi:hypothetical protein